MCGYVFCELFLFFTQFSELHPFHVVVSESWKHLVDEALQTIPSRQRPRKKLKSSQVLDISLRAGFVAMAENAMVHATARGARLRDVLDTEALRGHFQQYGPVVGVWIPRGRDRRWFGFFTVGDT